MSESQNKKILIVSDRQLELLKNLPSVLKKLKRATQKIELKLHHGS